MENSTLVEMNTRLLLRRLREYAVTLPQTRTPWRPTLEVVGYVTGLESLGELRCFATDGLVALALRGGTPRVVSFHVTHFTWRFNDVEETGCPPTAISVRSQQLAAGSALRFTKEEAHAIEEEKERTRANAQSAQAKRLDELLAL